MPHFRLFGGKKDSSKSEKPKKRSTADIVKSLSKKAIVFKGKKKDKK